MTECSDIIRKVIQKGFIKINEGYTSEGIRFEKYSLEPLWEKVIDHFLLQEKRKEVEVNKQEETKLYTSLNKNLEDHFHHLNVKHLAFGLMMTIMMPISLNLRLEKR